MDKTTPLEVSTINPGAVPFGFSMGMAPSGMISLFSIALHHLKPPFLEEGLNLLHELRLKGKRMLGDLSYSLPGEIVLCGANTAGRDDDLGSLDGAPGWFLSSVRGRRPPWWYGQARCRFLQEISKWRQSSYQ